MNLQTPNLSPFRLDDDDLFDFDSPPLLPAISPAADGSPRDLGRRCRRYGGAHASSSGETAPTL